MNNCPCCGTTLLRHINRTRLYWFCRHCWQEMPNFDSLRIINHYLSVKFEELPSLQKVSLVKDTSIAIGTDNKSHVSEELCEGKVLGTVRQEK
ncbi:MAG: hypothetical protein QNJ54_04310 [Prochloraceae cyanobacterium]|nr:hypothetical protein [Prochloraceae cyanobacterium]